MAAVIPLCSSLYRSNWDNSAPDNSMWESNVRDSGDYSSDVRENCLVRESRLDTAVGGNSYKGHLRLREVFVRAAIASPDGRV